VAKELKAGGAAFVVLESDDKRAAAVRELDYLCLVGDATSEKSLLRPASSARVRWPVCCPTTPPMSLSPCSARA